MKLGFDTIGNATIIAYDQSPVLITDPWIAGDAYFGSWKLSHEVPEEQQAAAKAATFAWFSHGHPDHLNANSFDACELRKKTILLPDHHGHRIKKDFEQQGFTVQVLADRSWVRLSDRIRVMCLADYNQDAVLLIDINGRLLVNLNDSGALGWAPFVARTAASYSISFLLFSVSFGDSDMANFRDEQGGAATPLTERRRFPLGPRIAKITEAYRTKYFIPFSSMHRYQRADSVWANDYIPDLSDYSVGFASQKCKMLPAFIRYRCDDDSYDEIRPPDASSEVFPPEQFGDHWHEPLEHDDVLKARSYFRSIEHLSDALDFVTLRVGGKDEVIELAARKFGRGITFEAPRGSLMTAVTYEVFDDMLIGNFMKTTLHGRWSASRLYPDFTPYVGKYADNGKAKSRAELADYLAVYRRRGSLDFLLHRFEVRAVDVIRSFISPESKAAELGRRVYWVTKGLLRR